MRKPVCWLMVAPLMAAQGAVAQPSPAGLRVESGDSLHVFPVVAHRGYAAVPARALERLGWTVGAAGDGLRALYRGDTLRIEPGSPFVRWQGQLYQFADAPYVHGGEVHVPAQFLLDWLPAVLGGSFALDPEAGVLRTAAAATVATVATAEGVGVRLSEHRDEYTARHSRVVVIDAGHGGGDPGAIGRLGTREKNVALHFAQALARELRRDSTIEVRLTREKDVLVPLWQRGEMATRWRGNRPSVFVSVHANSLPRSRAIRGFETYFLSEARTDHERRVAAIENAPLALEGEQRPASEDESLAFILKELVKLDHQHWSALLAEFVQRNLARVHPGPNRGVKQAPLAVVTNALMPAVLVELGFLSNRAEESLLRDQEFRGDAAAALGDAIHAFFRRYPPGQAARSEG
ncbi:MAG: N-acetylmuramoyl-L-alanine amidase [Gemmatimonadetes bacterium]|nr:N-acetylmuramoyl-L-alanine amidase [Gemmatimonadota bacterium]